MAKFEEIQQEIRKHEARIAELATELRNEVESLAEDVSSLENEEVECESDKETYYTPNGTETSSTELQEWADSVSEIEKEFDVWQPIKK